MVQEEHVVKFLIATHGHLADGFISTVRVIMGDEIANKIDSLHFFVDDEEESDNAHEKIKNYMQSLKATQQLIVFTDIMHGSVNQFIMPYANDEKVFIITGVNLPLLCEILAMYSFVEQRVEYESLQKTVMKSQKELLFVNECMKEKVCDCNEYDFFE